VYADNLSVVEVGGNVTGGDATSGFAAPGIYTENSTQITVGGDVTGGTATDGGESGAGIYAEYYGDYYEDNEEGIERGTVTVAGTVSGGEGAASIYFNAPESLAELVKEMEDLDLDAILEKDPEELTDDDYVALELALMAMISNGDLTEEELEAYGEEAGNINSIEEYMAFTQKVINAEKTQEIDLMDAFGEIGLEYSLITVGSVSKENGPAYGSNAGEQFAQKMGEKNVVETNVETPNTGDSFNPMLVLAVALVSLMGTAALVFKKKAA
jgi:LPXTG-motif cell wall-anchored protein